MQKKKRIDIEKKNKTYFKMTIKTEIMYKFMVRVLN